MVGLPTKTVPSWMAGAPDRLLVGAGPSPITSRHTTSPDCWSIAMIVCSSRAPAIPGSRARLAVVTTIPSSTAGGTSSRPWVNSGNSRCQANSPAAVS